MATYKHIRSSTANKRPTTSIADGQLAINTNTASPGLFFKDSAGTGIVKVGPVHVGTSAPNASPAAGGSSGNYLGEQWLDTSVSPAQMKVWNGSAWVGIVADELPVSKLQDGAARQLIQTDAAGTGVEWTSSIDLPGTLDVTSTATFDSIAQHPLGTAGAPTITFTGDNNTGIYSPGADQLALSTSGTQRISVDASGTTSLVSNIAVNGGELGSRSLRVTDGTTDSALIYGSNTGSVSIQGGASQPGAGIKLNGKAAASDPATIQFFTEATSNSLSSFERLRITSDGKLGLGTSSPSATLHTEGPSTTDTEVSYGFFAGGSSSQPGLTIGGNNTSASTITSTNRYSFIRSQQPNGTARSLFFQTGTDTRMIISYDGKVGVGTTGPTDKLHLHEASSNASYLHITNDTTGSAGGDGVLIGLDSSEQFYIYSQENNSMVFGTNNAERARIDSSGRLLVGTSSAIGVGNINAVTQSIGTEAGRAGFATYANSTLGAVIGLGKSRATSVGSNAIVSAGDVLGEIRFAGDDGTDLNSYGALIKAEVDGTPGLNDMPGRLVFSTTADGASSPTERMRIPQNGFTRFSNTGTYTSINANAHGFRTDQSDWVIDNVNDNANPYGIKVRYTAASPSNTSQQFLQCQDSAVLRAEIRSNGGLANYSANNANLSDRNAKKDISPAADTWDCIKEWEIVNYRYKDQPETADLSLGVIAQQVAESCPEVITVFSEATEDQPEKLGVKEQQMYWMAIKALQEAQVRIEALEAEVAALKAQ